MSCNLPNPQTFYAKGMMNGRSILAPAIVWKDGNQTKSKAGSPPRMGLQQLQLALWPDAKSGLGSTQFPIFATSFQEPTPTQLDSDYESGLMSLMTRSWRVSFLTKASSADHFWWEAAQQHAATACWSCQSCWDVCDS